MFVPVEVDLRPIRASNLELQQEKNHPAQPDEAHQAEVTIAGLSRVVLTPHEKQVVQLPAMGKSKEISSILAISTRTVEAHGHRYMSSREQ
jgi:DNA-binding NarL/FixJ family response regulator